MSEGRDVSRDTVSLTYEELAARLGIDMQSARRRALRQRWPKTRGNDGRARVAVPAAVLPAAGATAAAADATRRRDDHVGDGATVPATVLAAVQREAEVARAEAAELRGELAGLRE